VRVKGAATCALDVNPINHYQLSVGCSDSMVRLYDMRMLTIPSTGNIEVCANVVTYIYSDTTGYIGIQSLCCLPLPTNKEHTYRHRRVTSLAYSRDGNEILVNYSGDDVYVYRTKLTLRHNSHVLTHTFSAIYNKQS
jgi:nuclear receptor interaction protein